MSQLIGGPELIRKLTALPDKVFRRALGSAGRKATRAIIVKAKADVPIESGALKKSIGLRVKIYKKSGVMAFIVGPRDGFADTYNNRPRDPRYYAHLVEKGFRTRNGFHPGVPFLRPAIESQQALIVGTLGRQLGVFIEKQAGKT